MSPKLNNAKQKAKQKAKDLLHDRPRLLALVQQAEKLAGDFAQSPIKQKIDLANRLLRAWAKQEYTAIPWRSLLALTGGIVYLVNPLDLIPDFIAGAGFLDDLTVLKLILESLDKDLQLFAAWEANRHQNPPPPG